MSISRSIRALVVGGSSVVTVLAGMLPASAYEVRQLARDDQACAQQYEHVGRGVSPSCLPAGQSPGRTGLESNHNESLVRDST
jgi:hypothetical protein